MSRSLLALLAGAIQAGSAAGQQPDAWWRFEALPLVDSSPTGDYPLSYEPLGDTPPPYYIGNASDGCVGKYLHVDGHNVSYEFSAETAQPLPGGPSPGITVEFLFRLQGPDNRSAFNKAGNTSVIRGGNGTGSAGWEVTFDRHSIGFRAAGRVVSASLIGSGVRTIWTLTDGGWHHIACRLDAATGEQSIWVDGQLPDGGTPVIFMSTGGFATANVTTAPKQIPKGLGSVTLFPTAFDGDIDEVAVYSTALANGTIYAHFQTAIVQKSPYTFTPVTTPAPPPQYAGGQYNETDFANGTTLPTPIGNSSCSNSTKWMPLDQMQAFHSPRYLLKPATGPTIGVPQMNFNWMATDYMNGSPYKYFGLDKTWAVPQMNSELAKTWNYGLNVAAFGRGGPPSPTEETALTFAIADATGYTVDTIFQRSGTKTCATWHENSTLNEGCEKSWRFLNQTLAPSCYLQSAPGQYLTLTGAALAATDKKVLRPTTAGGATKNGCPDSLFADEWHSLRTYGHLRKAGLSGKIGRINNDGEYDIIYMHAATTFDPATNETVYDKDPEVVADYAASVPTIPLLPNGKKDWLTFVSRWRARKSLLFTTPLTHDPLSPELNGTIFTEYQIQGTNLFMGAWEETKKINTPVMNGGKLRYYATADLYPWIQTAKRSHMYNNASVPVSLEYGVPSWDVTHGSWHSIDWLQQVLPSQIATGDTVWSPFVAAGWSEQEEINTRPAQWLGFLKLLTVTGAEYFYGGFFSLHPPFPDSRNWIWQAAAPTYAQALTSHWLDALYEGELLPGDMPIAPVNCFIMEPMSDPMVWGAASGLGKGGHCETDSVGALSAPYVSYRFWAGSQSVAVFVRLLRNESKYIIASTVQPQSNFNEAPLEVNATIVLNGTEVRFTTRRQGSVFMLSNATGACKGTWRPGRRGNCPTLSQLDRWHQPTHFLRWDSRKMEVEAELHDDHVAVSRRRHPSQNVPQELHAAYAGLEPVTELAADARHDHDFVGSVTFVRLHGSSSGGAELSLPALNFSFEPRPVHMEHAHASSSASASEGDGHGGWRACEVSSRWYKISVRARVAANASSTVSAAVPVFLIVGGSGVKSNIAIPMVSHTDFTESVAPSDSQLLELKAGESSTISLTLHSHPHSDLSSQREKDVPAVDIDSVLLTEVESMRGPCQPPDRHKAQEELLALKERRQQKMRE